MALPDDLNMTDVQLIQLCRQQDSEIARLRDTNQVLFASRQEALRREDHQRLRAEAAENELNKLRAEK